MSTPVSSTFDGLASVDRYGNLAPIVVDRLDERYGGALSEAAADDRVAELVADADSSTRPAILDAVREATATLSAAQPEFGGGMRLGRTATENRAALRAAMAEATRRGIQTVTIPPGQMDLAPLGDLTGLATQIKGSGSRIHSGRRWNLGDARWATAGPDGTVLRAPDGMAADEALIDIPDSHDYSGVSVSELALVGRGAGVGLRLGWVPREGRTTAGGAPHRARSWNINIANFEVGTQWTCENSVIVAPYVVGCGIGIATNYPFNGNVVVGVNVEVCREAAILVRHSITNRWVGGVVQANSPTLGTIVVEGSAHENVFESIYLENYKPGTAEVLYDLRVGDTARLGPSGLCYGNAFLDMHWGSRPNQNPKLRMYAAAMTRLTSRHSASDTPNPPVELAGGWGHEVIGVWPGGVTGAAVDASTVVNYAGVGQGASKRQGQDLQLAPRRWVAPGIADRANLPTAVDGALTVDSKTGTLLEGWSGQWSPAIARTIAADLGTVAAGQTKTIDPMAQLTRVYPTEVGGTVMLPEATQHMVGRSVSVLNRGPHPVAVSSPSGAPSYGSIIGPKERIVFYCFGVGSWTGY